MAPAAVTSSPATHGKAVDAATWLVRGGLCFLLAAPVALGRALWTGQLSVVTFSWSLWLVFFLALGVPLTAGTWCILRALVLAQETPWRRLVHGSVWLHLLAWPVLPVTSNDLFSNLAYGRMMRLGLDPFRSGPSALGPGDALGALVAPRWLEVPSPYGPLSLALGRLSAVTDSVLGSLALFKLLMLGLSLGVVALAFAIARRLPAETAHRRALLLAASPLLVWEVTSQAHNDGLMALALSGVVWAGLSGQLWLALALSLLAVAAKGAALPVVALLAVLLLRQSRTRWRFLAAAAAAIGIIAMARPATLLAAVQAPLAASGAFDPERHTRSLADAVILGIRALTGPTPALLYDAFWGIHVLAVVAALVWVAVRVKTIRDVFHGSLIVLLVYLWTTPWSQPWYGTWLLPFIAVEEEEGLRRAAFVYTALLLVQYGLAFDPLTYLVVNGLPLWMLWRARTGRPLALPIPVVA
jgi:hypothetical protein